MLRDPARSATNQFRCDSNHPEDLASDNRKELGNDRRDNHVPTKRPVSGNRTGESHRYRRAGIRPDREREIRALPMWAVEEPAVLRRDSQDMRVGGGGEGARAEW